MSVGCSININSGYRCKKKNKLVKGKPDSEHLKGSAADLSCGNHAKLVQVCQSFWHMGKIGGLGKYATFCHIDLGRHRTWIG